MHHNNHPPHFDGLVYACHELSAFTYTVDTFILLLRDGRVVHFIPADTAVFLEWLKAHKIRDARV